MKIKEAEFKTVMRECKEKISDCIYGCDECKKEFESDSKLSIDIFSQSDSTENLDFCSWVCLLKHLPKVECNYFVNLPYLSYDSKTKGCNASDFINAIGKVSNNSNSA